MSYDSDVYARFYDLDFGDTDADLLMIQQFASRCGSPILDVACGSGRVLLHLARQGYTVTGVDIAKAMLARARRKVTAESLDGRVTLLQQDMRDLEIEDRFNLAVVAVNSFMHLLDVRDQLAALGSIRRHLQPGGLLLLDLFNPDPGRLLDARGQVYLDKVVTEPDSGHRLIRFRSQQVDLVRQILYVTFIIDEIDAEGTVQRTLFPVSMHYLFRGELDLLLGQAGFVIESVYGSYDLDDFEDDSDKMIAVARRLD